jgi:hypothetical protein
MFFPGKLFQPNEILGNKAAAYPTKCLSSSRSVLTYKYYIRRVCLQCTNALAYLAPLSVTTEEFFQTGTRWVVALYSFKLMRNILPSFLSGSEEICPSKIKDWVTI